MDFAADAVFDVIAPPARPAPARASASGEEATFDDHLKAATHESDAAPNIQDAPRVDEPRAQSAAPGTPDSADTLLGSEPLSVAAPIQPAQEQAASPVFVQLLTAAPLPATTPSHTAPAATTPPATPAPNPVSAGNTPSPLAAPAAAEPARAPAAQKSAAPTEKSAAPAVPVAPAAPPATQLPSAPATPGSFAGAASAAASAQTAPLAAAAVAAAPAQPTPEQAVRQPNAARDHAAKPDAASVSDRPAAPSPTAAPRLGAKAATPQNIAKEAVALPAADAPEAAATQQTASSAPPAAGAASAQTTHAVAEQSTARAAPAAHQVAREIVRRFENGATRFELRLDPPELGRVEVRLEVSRDQRVTAVIAADSPQALTELARHARDLEQMLQGAGLELGENGLSFDLRQGSERAEAAEFGGAIAESAAHAEDTTPVAARPLGYERWRGVRVDMMV